MATDTTRPEPGIATDEELETAADELWGAIEDTSATRVWCDRFDAIVGGDGSEVINVEFDGGSYSKAQVINAALQSDAPVKLRDCGGDPGAIVSFYPTNQAE